MRSRGTTSARAAWRVYEQRWRERLSAEFQAQTRLRLLAHRMSDSDIEQLFDLARTDGVMPIVRRTASFNRHRKLILALVETPACAATPSSAPRLLKTEVVLRRPGVRGAGILFGVRRYGPRCPRIHRQHVALGFLLPEPVGEPHHDAALFGKDVLQLQQDLDDFLETMDDADAALGRLLFERQWSPICSSRIAFVCDAPTTSRQLRN